MATWTLSVQLEKKDFDVVCVRTDSAEMYKQ